MSRRYLFLAAIDMLSAFRYTFLCQREERGGIAQLGERLHGMQEVRGSIPLVSTILTLTDAREILHPFFARINGAVARLKIVGLIWIFGLRWRTV